jgi:hypothetical protein
MTGRSVTSTSRSAEDCTRKPSGSGSTTMALYLATTAPRGPTNGPISLIYMLPLTTVLTCHSNHSQCGFDICSLVQEETSKFSKKQWPIPETGAMPRRSPNTTCSMTRSLPWQSRSRSINMTWTQLAPVSDHVSLDLCSRELQRGLPLYKTCRGKLEHYTQGGRRLHTCREAFMSILHHWRMSRNV